MLYARALRAGILPDLFWQSTPAEVVLMIRRVEDDDRRAWRRSSHLMALLYNINRGKQSRALEASDFFPYEEEKRYIEPTKITPDLVNALTQMQLKMNE